MNENMYLEQKTEKMGENLFMKTLLKKRLNQKGLTLIELLAVIVILAIVAAIAIPAISNLIQNQRDKAVLADASSIIAAAKLADAAGACKMETTDGADDECDQDNTAFADYVGEVQGVEAADGTVTLTYSVIDDGTDINLEYNAYANLSDDFDAGGITNATTSATETEINTALD